MVIIYEQQHSNMHTLDTKNASSKKKRKSILCRGLLQAGLASMYLLQDNKHDIYCIQHMNYHKITNKHSTTTHALTQDNKQDTYYK